MFSLTITAWEYTGLIKEVMIGGKYNCPLHALFSSG
jgi:hypothetical protein